VLVVNGPLLATTAVCSQKVTNSPFYRISVTNYHKRHAAPFVGKELKYYQKKTYSESRAVLSVASGCMLYSCRLTKACTAFALLQSYASFMCVARAYLSIF